MKDHEKAALVSALTKIARDFAGTQQLRERISHCVIPALDQAVADEREACARLEANRWNNTEPGNTERDLAYCNWHEERRKRLTRRIEDIKDLLIADGSSDSGATEAEARHLAIKADGMGITDKEIWDSSWEAFRLRGDIDIERKAYANAKEALRKIGADNAWRNFGECRTFGELPVDNLTPSDIDKLCRLAI